MSVQFFRYIGSGPENDELLKRVREKAEAVYTARKVLTDKYGAQGFIMDGWRGSKPTGLYFTERQNLPFLKQETHLGENLYGYYPKLNTKKGKELYEELVSPLLEFSASCFILDALKLHRYVHSARTLAYSTAGYTKTSILVSIPAGENEFYPMPELPAWLREVKESEWQAAQGN